MPELLKDLYSKELIHSIAGEFKTEYPKFNQNSFTKNVLFNDWESLELKARMRHVAIVIGQHLPSNYASAIKILLPVAKKFSGLEHVCFPEFVEEFGLDHFDISMKALEHLTSGSSSEFAIRPFILREPDRTMKQMEKWSKSKCEHVRRLASEGCRPRLPWSMALPDYKKDPTPVLAIIEKLVDDESLYVRRSVANNLNDISKDNPHFVIEIAERFLGQSDDIDWTIKHACRGLLKQGNKEVLSLFGYSNAEHIVISDFIVDKKISLGDKLNFKFEINSNTKSLGKLRLEFVIDFMKSNGKTAAKIFKISEGDYSEATRQIKKHFSFKPISTRKYYLGKHAISIVVNGDKITTQKFELVN